MADVIFILSGRIGTEVIDPFCGDYLTVFKKMRSEYESALSFVEDEERYFDVAEIGVDHAVIQEDSGWYEWSIYPQELEGWDNPAPNECISVTCPFEVGDMVVVEDEHDPYHGLKGEVIDIVRIGTPEHDKESDNECDLVHVNFLACEYSAEEKERIEGMFSALYDMPKTFDEIPLDDVIMDPEALIIRYELLDGDNQ